MLVMTKLCDVKVTTISYPASPWCVAVCVSLAVSWLVASQLPRESLAVIRSVTLGYTLHHEGEYRIGGRDKG